ncbi:EFR3 [Candida pseudojiufengensis]|uniref:EFR3 n=1 Tax=Candida pseudojiufengensis TaxID=497109 RepID=UPI0022258327|nr:EFR3 [Candida pseudojiufengensis]KAI5960564.1 EFR3 [Candida pseudojiufengensis]
MNKIFQHKHQKLILQCYPAGKATDKKPNSSELSYLLYYASTRRIKLEKVIHFIKEKTQHDAARNRTGNLQVTLAIIKELIEKCKENLNVFAPQVCTIMKICLDTKDISVCKNVVKTYEVLCKNLDGALFSGDKEFVQEFTDLSQQLINTGKEKNINQNQLDWQMISIKAINSISNCLGYSNNTSKKFIAISIPFLIQIIMHNNNISSLVSKLKSNINVESDGKRLSRVQSQKSQTIVHQQIDDDFDNDNLTITDVNEEAMIALKSFFNNNTTAQISEVTRAVVQHIYSTNLNLDWGIVLLELCVTWIPIQLRFVSSSTLLSTLNRMNVEGPSKSNYNLQLTYAKYLLGLLSSGVNMIGLSISDIIQQLLNLQTDLILKPSDLSKSEIDILTNIYSDCICNVTTHIYYYDQVPDSIQEILVKTDYVLDNSFVDNSNQTTSGERIHDLIIQFLDNISKIFLILKNKTSSINRNHVNLEHWDISLGLLAPESEFDDGRKTVLTIQQIHDIQAKYLKVFDEFLNNELAIASKTAYEVTKQQSRLDPGSQFNNNNNKISDDLKTNSKNLIEPDVNQYITQQQNFISHLLMYTDKFFDIYESPNTELVLLLVTVLKDMITILGLNFTSNFIPFFHHWVLKLNKTNEFNQSQMYKDTIAHIILYYILKNLDQQYSEDLDNYCKNSKLFKQILDGIGYRKQYKLWIHGLDSQSSDLESFFKNGRIIPKDNFGKDLKIKIQKENIEEFACGNNFLIVWLHPQKPLLTDIEKSQISTHMSTFNNDSRNTYNNNAHMNFEMNNENDEFESGPPTSDHFIPQNFINRTGLSSDVVSSDSEKGLYTGLGLGTTADINSIHQEILQFSQHFQERGLPHANSYLVSNYTTTIGDSHYDDTNGSIYTYNSKVLNHPRISDLKDSISFNNQKFKTGNVSNGNGNGHSIMTSRQMENTVSNDSILNKNLLSTDVDSILGGLDSDDDVAFIV